jgi:hypothetical protein
MEKDSQSVNDRVEELLTRFCPRLPALKCPSGNTTTMLCVNKECEQKAHRCGDKECAHCGDKWHKRCCFVPLEEIGFMLKMSSKKCRGALSMLIEMEDEFVEGIRREQKKVIEELSMGAAMQTIKEVFEAQKLEAFKGR